MADYTNPAGRLHEVLTRFGSNPNVSILDGWANALSVPAGEVPYHLGQVAALLVDVRNAAAETGSDAFRPMPDLLGKLAESIFPTTTAFARPVSDATPNAIAMQLLAALSYALELSAPEGKIPDDDELDDLKQSVRDLIADIADSELPPEVRRALLHRLAEMLEALEHLEVGGPNAVRRAAESLAVTAVLAAESAEDPTLIGKIAKVARTAWTAFTVTTAIAASALTWEKLVDMTGLLNQSQEQRQLPPGPPAAHDDELGSPPHA